MRTTIALFFVLVGSLAIGQGSMTRVKAIWIVASNRMITQQDAWFDDGDYPACISVLKVESEKWPSDYDIWTNLGWMQENIRNDPGALSTYTRFRSLNPQDPDRALPEAQFLFQKKEYEQVPPILSEVIKKKCHPNNYRLLAWSYERLKKYPEAIKVWKSFMAKFPDDKVVRRNIDRDEKKLLVPSTR